MKIQTWNCRNINCKAYLGTVEGDVLHVKRRDMYIDIVSAKSVSMKCYRCGVDNILYEQQNSSVDALDARKTE